MKRLRKCKFWKSWQQTSNSDHTFTIFAPGCFVVIAFKMNGGQDSEPAVAPCSRRGLSVLMTRLRAAGCPSVIHRCSVSPQIVAAILAIAGIVMMTYADGFHSHSVIGITLVVASASMSALYKVFVSLSSKNKRNTSSLNTTWYCWLSATVKHVHNSQTCIYVWIFLTYIRDTGPDLVLVM